MAHTISWYLNNQILKITLDRQQTLRELREVNEQIDNILSDCNDKVILLFDTSQMLAGYQTADMIRKTMLCINHPNLDSIVSITTNKLNRLIMLLALSLSSVKMVQFDSQDLVTNYFKQNGYMIPT